jgi:hypothetical protein
MTNRAIKIANKLLKQRRKARRSPVTQRSVNKATIFYGDLCRAVGTGRKKLGRPLKEIAEWCQKKKLPPLNALAVSRKTHEPSDDYDGAGGFRLSEWCCDVRKCLANRKYPRKF